MYKFCIIFKAHALDFRMDDVMLEQSPIIWLDPMLVPLRLLVLVDSCQRQCQWWRGVSELSSIWHDCDMWRIVTYCKHQHKTFVTFSFPALYLILLHEGECTSFYFSIVNSTVKVWSFLCLVPGNTRNNSHPCHTLALVRAANELSQSFAVPKKAPTGSFN